MQPPAGTPAGPIRFHSPPGSETDDVGAGVGVGVGAGVVPLPVVVAVGVVGEVAVEESFPHALTNAAATATEITAVLNLAFMGPPSRKHRVHRKQ
jgi:hypothetical protein